MRVREGGRREREGEGEGGREEGGGREREGEGGREGGREGEIRERERMCVYVMYVSNGMD